MSLKNFIDKYTNAASYREIARQLGMNAQTLTNHLKQLPPQPQTLLQVARHYGIPPLQLLMEAEILNEDDVEYLVVKPLSSYTDRELALEILRRAEQNPDSELNQPNYDKISARKVAKMPTPVPDDVPEYDPETMVASQESEFIPPDDEFIP